MVMELLIASVCIFIIIGLSVPFARYGALVSLILIALFILGYWIMEAVYSIMIISQRKKK